MDFSVKELAANGKFSFKNQKQRLSSVAFHSYHKKNSVDHSFYLDSLEKWIDLNCTSAFARFKQKASWAVSLELILLRNSELVETLLEFTDCPDCIEPILELIVSLSRDLLEEFYPHLTLVLTKLVSILEKEVY
jgi:hypothetical protein